MQRKESGLRYAYALIMTTIAHRIARIRAQIDTVTQQAGRPAQSVGLLAVSKTFTAEAIAEAALAGQRDFGENYVQEGVEKITQCQAMPALPPLVWHCIGPVQSNKTRWVAEYFDWLHTLEKVKIIQRLGQQRPAHLAPLQVCIQVNIDGGPSKAGCLPEEVPALAAEVARWPRLQLRGIMAIPDPVDEPQAMLAVHQRAAAIFQQLRAAGYPQVDTLSLGMSADWPLAVAAGSTMVRIGSAIFGARNSGKAPGA